MLFIRIIYNFKLKSLNWDYRREIKNPSLDQQQPAHQWNYLFTYMFLASSRCNLSPLHPSPSLYSTATRHFFGYALKGSHSNCLLLGDSSR